MNMHFNPVNYTVPDVIVEGLTIFAGKPKIGKSWLLLHAANAIAEGGTTLGGIKCTAGDVLYCALEDNPRRLQSRMKALFGKSRQWSERLTFVTEMPRLAEGGLKVIADWIAAAEHPRLVIIDTLAMVRMPNRKDQTSYDADYSAVVGLRTLAQQHGIAIALVHHLRKADSDDPFDTVSGTLGLTGAADAMLVLRRDTTGGIVLHGRGRDLAELEKAAEFDRGTCTWRLRGDASVARRSSERNAILAAMREIGQLATPTEIAAAAGLRPVNVRQSLRRMANDGLVCRAERGKYETAQWGVGRIVTE
jgi:DNA-binding transcriptional ArsR family regulator